MNRETWTLIKNSKNFNVNIYRRGLVVLIVSLILSSILGIILFYLYITEPERDYYATSGIIPPIKLKSLPTRNFTSNALLPPDPLTEPEDKLIPQ